MDSIKFSNSSFRQRLKLIQAQKYQSLKVYMTIFNNKCRLETLINLLKHLRDLEMPLINKVRMKRLNDNLKCSKST